MTGAELGALAQVIGIDVLLAGDNAIAIGALASTVAPALRTRALVIGVALAMAIRIAASLGVSWLFGLPGVMLIGGAVLVLVALKLAVDIVVAPAEADARGPRKGRSFASAICAIALADIMLSVDNVLGVAGAAAGHPAALVIGLGFSIVLMGTAATVIARVIERHRWIAWVGVILIAIVAVRMIVAGVPSFRELIL